MISGILLALLGAFAFIIVLSSLVFFHELGHYSVARFFGVAVEKFSIGMGKPIVKWKAKSGTEWSISRLPIGGYVKFLGDAGGASNPDAEQLAQIKADMETEHGAGAAAACFHFKPLWQRVLIVLAGPVANFILAILIFAGYAWMLGVSDHRAFAGEIVPNLPAEVAGIQTGDEILTMNGMDASTANKILRIVKLRADTPIETELLRDGQPVTLTVTPRRVAEKDFIGGASKFGKIGMGFEPNPDYRLHTDYGPISAFGWGVNEVKFNIQATGYYISRIFSGREDGKALGGPIRIAAMTGGVAVSAAKADVSFSKRLKGGAINLIMLAAVLSIGLGVANLMPIPVLDGGHLVYYGYEAIAGRPLSERKQELGFKIGLSVLLGLFLILTWNDIGYVRSLFS